MGTNRPKISVLIGALLLATSVFAAAPGKVAPAQTPAEKSQTSFSGATNLCSRAPALCSASYLDATSRPVAASLRNLPDLRLADPVYSMAFGQGSAAGTTKSGTGQEPTLQGLGFPSSEIKGSAKEQALLNKRSHMLQIHQKLGLITAIPMYAALFTGPGAKGHHGLPGSPSGRELHASLGAATVGLYIATAYFAIKAPKVPGTEPRGLIRLHRAMAWIHGPGMVLTPILGAIAYSQLSNGERIHGIAKYNSDAAVTTAVAYGVAMLSVMLK